MKSLGHQQDTNRAV